MSYVIKQFSLFLYDSDTVSSLSILIAITVHSPSGLGQETPKGPCGQRVNLPPAHLSTTHGVGFPLTLYSAEGQARKL